MEFTRREMLTSAGAAALLAPLSGLRAQPEAPGFADIAPRVRAFAEAVLAQNGFPGVSISLVGPDGFSSAFAAGLADLDSRVPASADQLFQIGSITKSLTAMALFALAGSGRLDLDGRVQDLLPEVPLPPQPISVRNLLEHSSGLPNSLEESPFLDVPGGLLWTGFEPGSRYSYCNLGYTLLGMILERAARMPYPQAMRSLVLAPIGMASAKPVIRGEDRALYATGHTRFRDDIPWLPRGRLAAARWMDVHTAAGSVGANAHDMVRYLERLVALGRGRGAPLFPDALAERYRRPTIASSHGPGARYGNGLVTLDVGGHPCFRHTGGMIGFSSAITVDPAAGIGCHASVNVGGAGGYRPIEINEYAIALLRAAAAGEALPAAPEPRRASPFPEAERILGRWTGPDGRVVDIARRGDALAVATGGIEALLLAHSSGVLVTDHPGLAPYALAFEAGETPRLRIGDRMFARGPAPPASSPPRFAALAGAYYSPGAWGQRLNAYAVGERLILGFSDEIRQAGDGSWRFADPELAAERFWFEHEENGRPRDLNFSGTRYSRQPEP
jgi:D-alanyl-D-alanine carboxypeptidase